MDFKTKSFLTLSGKRGGLLGSEMYLRPEDLHFYEKIVCESRYYPAHADIDNWRDCAKNISSFIPQSTTALEYGPGERGVETKTGAIIKSLNCRNYLAVDKSRASLESALESISKIKKDIKAIGIDSDFLCDSMPTTLKRSLAIFSGCSIGNLETPILQHPPTSALTAALKTLARPVNGGWLLISSDMWLPNKRPEYYVSAYNSPFHENFNLGVLHRIAEELKITGFDPTAFFYKPVFHCQSKAILHLAFSKRKQAFFFDGVPLSIEKGQPLHLNTSFKFEENNFVACVNNAGLSVLNLWKHKKHSMRIYLLQAQACVKHFHASPIVNQDDLTDLKKCYL